MTHQKLREAVWIVLVSLLFWFPAAWASDSVSGTITANGKVAKLSHVLARQDEPYMGDDVVELVFSEKDASGTQDPVVAAQLDRLGAALVVKLRLKDMAVVGCEVSHPALKRSGMSVLGKLKPLGVKVEDGQLGRKLKTDKPVEFLGDTFEVASTFQVAKP